MTTPLNPQWTDLMTSDPVGPGSENTFDDSPATLDKIEAITKIVVRSGSWIDRLTVFYGDTSLPHGGDGGEDNVIDIDPGDFLVEVSGYYNFEWVYQLSFKTKTGKEFGPYGQSVTPEMVISGGFTFFSYEARDSEAIVAFCGSVTDPIPHVYLASIGFAVATYK